MLNVLEITIEEFRNNIYDYYVKLFPDDEQREWKNIIKTYNDGIEKFYKILVDDNTIGFFLLEKVDDNPYYLDYFAIYPEYQSKGYGSQSIKYLINNIIGNDGLIGEIEEVRDTLTTRRWNFYKKLGFKMIDSLYFLYNVLYVPIVVNLDKSKEEVDKIFLTYYKINCGEEGIKENCKFIK